MPIVVHIAVGNLKGVIAWGILLVGFALYAQLFVQACQRAPRRAPPRVRAGGQRRQRCPRSDWELVTDVAHKGLAQAESARALHVRAGERIDAAEYAFNQLLGECAAIMAPSTPATLLTMPAAARGGQPYGEASLAA